MRQTFHDVHAWLVLRHPAKVVAAWIALAIVAIGPVLELPVKTGRLDLVPPDDSTVVAFRQMDSIFGAVHTVFAIVDGPGQEARRCVDAAGEALAACPKVRATLSKLDLRRLAASAVRAMDPQRIAALAQALDQMFPALRQALVDPAPETFLSSLAQVLGDKEAPPPSVDQALAAAHMVTALAQGLSEALQKRHRPRAAPRAPAGSEVPGGPAGPGGLEGPEGPEGPGGRDGRNALMPALDVLGTERERRHLDEDGYIVSLDGRRLLMLISPRDPADDPVTGAALLSEIKKALAPVVGRFNGVSITYGGAPVQDALEDATVKRDMTLTSFWATAVVFILSALAFRSAPIALLANLVMGLAVFLTLAVARLLVGHLNVISSVFAAVLVGVGIDFGIYLYQLYLDALPEHGAGAMRHALARGTRGILTGAATPAAAFLSLTLHRFPAFHDLGLIAGLGVLISVAAMLVLFPAILALAGPVMPDPSARRAAPISGWLVRASQGFCRAVPAATVLLVALLAVAPAAPFDYDLSHLQAAASEAALAEQALRRDFGLSSDVVMVRTRDLAAAARVARALAGRREIGLVDSPAELVPAVTSPVSGPLAHILAIGRALPAARSAHSAPVATTAATMAGRAGTGNATGANGSKPPPVDSVAKSAPARTGPASALSSAIQHAPMAPASRSRQTAMLAAIDMLAPAIARLRSLAGVEESAALLAAAGEAADALAQAREDVRRAPADTLDGGLALVSAGIAGEVSRCRDALLALGTTMPYTIASLPPELEARYVGRDGSLATYVWPRADLAGQDEARAFVAAVESTGEPLAGTPVMSCRMLDMIREGFLRAAMAALAIILGMVLLDLKSPRLTVLGLLPMGCGTIAGIAFLALSGRSWNPVNSMALPVMLGEGVGFGVNLVHRWLDEASVDHAVAGTGRAVLYAAGTSITGFGSLMLAQHRGLSSFGALMAVGTFAELVVALTVLPRVLRILTPR